MTPTERVAALNQLMVERAADLAILLNRLGWPEARGPYYPRHEFKHSIKSVGDEYRITLNHSTAMFLDRTTMDNKFVNLCEDEGVDVVARLATDFLDWITEQHDAMRKGLATLILTAPENQP